MIITLQRASYNTDQSTNAERLKKYIPSLRSRRKTETLDSIATQIEQATILTRTDIDIYQRVKNTDVRVQDIKYQYFTSEKLTRDTTKFIYVNGTFYPLPDVEKKAYYPYALVDKLLYESRHNDWRQPPCTTLRAMINRFIPGSIRWKKVKFEQFLTKNETEKHTYFGEYPSDDSDSEEETEFRQQDETEKMQTRQRARVLQQRAKVSKYQKKLKAGEKPPKPDLTGRAKIIRGRNVPRQARADLKALNEAMAENRLNAQLLESLPTKFLVAQYRGIHYLTSKWDKVARKNHREMDERNKAQFSSSVLAENDISSYHELITRLEEEKFEDTLEGTAEQIQQMLILMQNTAPVSYDGYLYWNLFYLFQEWYSANYDAFPQRIAADLAKQQSVFRGYVLNNHRPLLSTADTPYHALKYAYGVKLYDGHGDERLRPRWWKSGRAERPYSGKIYVSLHPLTDYVDKSPSHLTSLFKKGQLKLSNFISPERETSFLAYLPADRVFLQHLAKYPSFKDSDYKTIYAHKYGIDEPMFKLIRAGFKRFPPHSEKRRQMKQVLGEYFCAYQEVRMVEEARLEAKRRGATLIYRNENGGFSLELPDTPTTANPRLKRIVMRQREIYKMLAPSKVKKIQRISRADIARQVKRLGLSGNKIDTFVDRMFFKQPRPRSLGEHEEAQAAKGSEARIRR